MPAYSPPCLDQPRIICCWEKGALDHRGTGKFMILKVPQQNKLLLTTLLAAFSLIALIAIRWNSYQWDLHAYYGSVADFLQGTSPYRGGIAFYYPPITLYLFYGLLAQIPFALAYQVWLALKITA